MESIVWSGLVNELSYVEYLKPCTQNNRKSYDLFEICSGEIQRLMITFELFTANKQNIRLHHRITLG